MPKALITCRRSIDAQTHCEESLSLLQALPVPAVAS